MPNFIGRFTRPKGTKDYPYIISLKKTKILKEFYMLFFVFKTVENLIAVSEKFSSVLPAAVAEVIQSSAFTAVIIFAIKSQNLVKKKTVSFVMKSHYLVKKSH